MASSKEYQKTYDAVYRIKNAQKIRDRQRRWYLENKSRLIAKANARQAVRWEADPEGERKKARERERLKRIENPEKVRAHRRRYETRRRREVVGVALRGRVACMIRSALTRRGTGKGGRSWQKILPYTVEELRARLNDTMPTGYTWADFLSGKLHVDHIVPVAVHNFSSPDDLDFQHCWALSNLQLLPRFENQSKQDKLTEPFQPALPLAISRGAAV